MSKKHSPGGAQHTEQQQQVITPLSDGGSTLSKLSTFSSTGSKPAGVQMRRTTNKRGKTAPAPPKRTR